MQVRKFLKKLGVTSQREIEQAVRGALAERKIIGNEELPVRATISIDRIGLSLSIDGTIALE